VRTLFGHEDWVRCAIPSEDGKLIASCSNDQVKSKFTITNSISNSNI
jgi:hypothetical protein